MNNEGLPVSYFPEPTPYKFHDCDDFVRGIMGPIGSGKSTACCMEIFNRARCQQVNAQGIRKSKWAIVRNTFGELKSTTISTWKEWFPESVCPIVYDSPIRGQMNFELPDKTKVELELLFIALDQPKHISKIQSLEITGAWINEARFIEKAILNSMIDRLGRYPAKKDGGFNWTGLIMDTNPPDDDHWWYKYAEEETPENWAFFKQPPAVLYDDLIRGWKINPFVENVKNHTQGPEYWLSKIPGKTREWIRVYYEGKYGSVQDGKPVYPEYNDDTHTAKNQLTLLKNLPIYLGWDFGLTPAVIFAQITPRGRLITLDEIVSESMGLRQFLDLAVMPRIARDYKGFNFVSIGDPAGKQRSQADEKSCFEELRVSGFEPESPWTNSFQPRRDAVAGFLTRMVDGLPCLQVSPNCKTLRKGFMGGYRYRRVQIVGEERYQDKPDKNMFSHPHDAFQMICLYLQGRPLDFYEKEKYPENEARKAQPSNRISGGM